MVYKILINELRLYELQLSVNTVFFSHNKRLFFYI